MYVCISLKKKPACLKVRYLDETKCSPKVFQSFPVCHWEVFLSEEDQVTLGFRSGVFNQSLLYTGFCLHYFSSASAAFMR